jgi:hypothetical protein
MKKLAFCMGTAIILSALVRLCAIADNCPCLEASESSSTAACTKHCEFGTANGASNCTFTTSSVWKLQCGAREDNGEWKCVRDDLHPTMYTQKSQYSGTCLKLPLGSQVCSTQGAPPDWSRFDNWEVYMTVSCYGY